jgi:SNF2 family DNA or RNA helicase
MAKRGAKKKVDLPGKDKGFEKAAGEDDEDVNELLQDIREYTSGPILTINPKATFQKASSKPPTVVKDKDIKECSKSATSKSVKSKDKSSENKCKKIASNIDEILEETYEIARSIGKEPKDYQKLAVRHMTMHDGLIAAFQVGTGKTLTAVMAINAVENVARLVGKNFLQIYIVTPASLVDNIKKEMKLFGLNIASKHYHFYTIQLFGKRLKEGKIDCTDSFLIIDEAHALRTDYRSEFGGFIEKEGTIAESVIGCGLKIWKSLILTATPLYNAPHDIVNLLAIAKKSLPLGEHQWSILTEDEQKLNDAFNCTILFQDSNKADFPQRIDKIVYIPMTREYYNNYYKIERKIRMSELRERSFKTTDDEDEKNAFFIKLKKASNNLEPCLKCEYVIENVINLKQKTVIYSALRSAGIDVIKNYLDTHGLSDSYLTISGSIPQKDRQKIVDKFNDPAGPYILFITKAGSEGLDLRAVRHVVILEQGWNMATNEQAIGRGIRFRSHAHLPEEERNVTVHQLIMKKPQEVIDRLRKLYGDKKPGRGQELIVSGDEYFYNITVNKEKEIQKLYRQLVETDLKHSPCKDKVIDIEEKAINIEEKEPVEQEITVITPEMIKPMESAKPNGKVKL